MDILERIMQELATEKRCKRCGTLFPATHPARMYCSNKCARAAARKRILDRDEKEAQERKTTQAAINQQGTEHIVDLAPPDRMYPEPGDL